MSNDIAECESAADKAVEFSSSPESRAFFLKAALRLSPGQVLEAIGEIKMREHSVEYPVHDKAKFLIWTLSQWMKDAGVDESQGDGLRPSGEILDCRPLSQRPLSKFRALKVLEEDIPVARIMRTPFSKKFIPWLRHLTNDFFTLTNTKNKWDEIQSRFEWEGQTIPVNLIRGKLTPDDRAPQGIPTVEDMRVLTAAVKAWSDETRGTYEEYDTSAKSIVFTVEVQRLCEIMGISKGGKQIEDITNSLLKLMRTGYYFQFHDSSISGFNFRFINDVHIVDKRENNLKRRHIRITFSEPYSRLLVERDVVSRPPNLLTIRGDIAFKLAVYFFPILAKKGHHEIELNDLIDKIGLVRAGWSDREKGYKSQRKQQFEKSINELNGKPFGDGRVFSLQIIQGLNKADFILEARLISPALAEGEDR